MDFSKTSTEQLKRDLCRHENDRSTFTVEDEMRRMYLVQEIGAELQRREPPKPQRPKYVPMRVSHVVISRPGPDLRWWECARFDDPISASNHCMALRRAATNPGFECMFLEEKRDEVAA